MVPVTDLFKGTTGTMNRHATTGITTATVTAITIMAVSTVPTGGKTILMMTTITSTTMNIITGNMDPVRVMAPQTITTIIRVNHTTIAPIMNGTATIETTIRQNIETTGMPGTTKEWMTGGTAGQKEMTAKTMIIAETITGKIASMAARETGVTANGMNGAIAARATNSSNVTAGTKPALIATAGAMLTRQRTNTNSCVD
jgi:hypothetical protein